MTASLFIFCFLSAVDVLSIVSSSEYYRESEYKVRTEKCHKFQHGSGVERSGLQNLPSLFDFGPEDTSKVVSVGNVAHVLPRRMVARSVSSSSFVDKKLRGVIDEYRLRK
jgi:hypothetical protein